MVNDEILAIKERLQGAIAPTRIYLFGSFATGNHHADSDYDFYLVVPDDAGDRIALSQKAYRSLRGMRDRRPVDIVVNYESSFAQRQKLPTLERTVAKEGVLLHG